MSDNVMHNAPDSSRLNSSTVWGSVVIWSFFGVMLVVFAVLLVLALQEEPQASAVDFNKQEASVLAALSPQVSIKTSQETSFSTVDGTRPVTAGTEIRTSGDGEAVLFSSDGVLTTLEENTRVELESIDNQNQQSRLQLLAGSLWARIGGALTGDESYEVQAANVVTSVRGTEFGLTVDEDDSVSVTTLRDEVALESPGTATDTLSVLSGEQVELPSTVGTQLAANDPTTLSAEEIRNIINEHTEVDQRLSDPQLQEVAAVMDDIPTLAESEDQQEAGGLERFSESVYTTLFASGQNERIRTNILRAQERLQEARANIEDPTKLEGILQNYRRVVRRATRQAAESANTELQQLVAKATRQDQKVLSDLMGEAADPARNVIRGVQSAARESHKQAINALASTSPKTAYEEGTRTMKSRLRSVQTEAASGNNLDVRDALGEYDEIMQANAKSSRSGGSSTQASFAGELRKSLSVIDTVERFGSSLAPGIRRAMNEAEDRTADTQLASIAAIATSSPQQAVDIYDKTASMYLDRLERSNSPEEVRENTEVYNKYASFAEDVSRSVSDRSAGTSSLQQRFREVADKQLETLTRVQQQVPEQARNAIQEAIDRQQQAQRPNALPSELDRQDQRAESQRPDQVGTGTQPGQQDQEQSQGRGQGPDVQPEERGLDDYLQEVRERSPQGDMESLRGNDRSDQRPDSSQNPSEARPSGQTPNTQQVPGTTTESETREPSTQQQPDSDTPSSNSGSSGQPPSTPTSDSEQNTDASTESGTQESPTDQQQPSTQNLDSGTTNQTDQQQPSTQNLDSGTTNQTDQQDLNDTSQGDDQLDGQTEDTTTEGQTGGDATDTGQTPPSSGQ